MARPVGASSSQSPFARTPLNRTGLFRIFHPTDFSPESHVAFAHALKLALLGQGELRMMHVDSHASEADWSDFPQVRDTLVRWGVLAPGCSREDVVRLGVRIEKILAHEPDPAKSLEAHLKRYPADLLVLMTHQHDRLERWISKSVAEPVARETGVPALFVPAGVEGFVKESQGLVQLRHIVIPIGQSPNPQPAVDAAVALVRGLGPDSPRFTLLHIGSQDDLPELQLPRQSGWSWDTQVRTGDIVEEILSQAQAADMIVMATAGHQGLLDALRGSTTERVLRQVPCPLVAIPAAPDAGP